MFSPSDVSAGSYQGCLAEAWGISDKDIALNVMKILEGCKELAIPQPLEKQRRCSHQEP